jgi:uncharacterized membrane protein
MVPCETVFSQMLAHGWRNATVFRLGWIGKVPHEPCPSCKARHNRLSFAGDKALEFLLLVAVLGLAFWLFVMRGELAFLRRRISELDDALYQLTPVPDQQAMPRPTKVAARKVATVVGEVAVTPAAPPPPPVPGPNTLSFNRPEQPSTEAPVEPERGFTNPLAGASFEELVGGKLPIWIGGIALVFAGFFLVRYTIEAGLLGPGARSIIATIFAVFLIALSEFGGKLPKLGDSFTADPRIAQSLAGAGVATLYGTLYMAAEIYGLIGVGTAFVLVVVTTIIAFILSLRHGPPTALMGLIGGFAAPWVAGMGSANLPSLLLYLAVFIAALFGLAVWRRWLWLLVLASGGGALWSFAMLMTAQSDFVLLGLFVLVAGGGALIAFSRFDEAKNPWTDVARYAPMGLALVQLAILLPRMGYSLTGWLFYAVLSVATIVLAWRDRRLVPLAEAALLIGIVPLSEAWNVEAYRQSTLVATFGIALLFGGAGIAAILRERQPAIAWAVMALAAPVLCWLAAYFSYPLDTSSMTWGYAALAAALPAAWLAWNQHQRSETGLIQILASGTAALMLVIAAGHFADHDSWTAMILAAAALGLAAWAKVTGDGGVRRLAILPLGSAMLWAAGSSWMFLNALAESLAGETDIYNNLPVLSETIKSTLVPALMMLAIVWQPIFATGKRTRTATWVVGGAGLAAFVWLLAKQAAGIDSPSDFIRLGFAERAVFTLLLFAAGWLALREAGKRADWPALKIIGWVLAGAALFRVVWFDLALLNPVFVAQAVGPVPIANLAVGHMALVAIWLWLLSAYAAGAEKWPGAQLALQSLSLGAMIVATLATVRQAMQGSIMAKGFIDTGENYLYSVGLMALAIVWLARGMMAGSRLLRIAGLGLLTAVTLKVFLIDAASLTGVLRILSFLGLGIALIGIGWAYGRVMGTAKANAKTDI